MKIKTKEMSYAEVLALPAMEHKNPYKQTPFWRWLLKTVSAGELKQIDFSCEKIGMETISEEEPCLFLMNHSSFTDLQIASTLLKDRSYHIVCTNDGFIGKEWLMRKLGCIPAKKFIGDVAMVKDMKYAADKLGSSILMFPEASYSFDGCETPLPDSLGKCVRMLKIPVVMIRTTGAFLRDPLYNCLQKRNVKVSATMSVLISKEEATSLPVDQLNEKMAAAFQYDHFKEQHENGVKVSESFRADGLHRVLYKCPSCMTEGEMEGIGTTITCKFCKEVHELREDGTLSRVSPSECDTPCQDRDKTRFQYVSDWYRWEREQVRTELAEGLYQLEQDVEIMILKDLKCMYKVGTGHLSHSGDGFHLFGCDGELDYYQTPAESYSLYADYFWYEIGDMISIGNTKAQYYCFPIGEKQPIVAKARLAAEELYKMVRSEK